MVAISEIEEFCRELGRRFSAERVILFGSYARGTVTEDSDVDLLEGRYPDSVQIPVDSAFVRDEISRAREILIWLKRQL